jgi:hypothetical protein
MLIEPAGRGDSSAVRSRISLVSVSYAISSPTDLSSLRICVSLYIGRQARTSGHSQRIVPAIVSGRALGLCGPNLFA